MKRSLRPRGTGSNLSESTLRRINMYALAAGAAGVGIVALSQSAEGKIVYTPVHRVIGPHHTYNIDLNHDKITDFTIKNSVSACTDYCFFELRENPAAGNSAAGYTTAGQAALASALIPGAVIGPRKIFKNRTGAMVVARSDVNTSGRTIVYGPWVNVRDRYLGLKFQINGKTHYGWARMRVTISKTVITATLTGYAYETVPGKSIVAGQTSDRGEISINEPNATLGMPTGKLASLGMLAQGSSGLLAWRREIDHQLTATAQ